MSRRARRALGAAAVLGLAAGLARIALPVVPGWFIRADPLAPCDVIMVAGSNPAGSTEVEAVRLWRRGLGRYLLCVGRPAAWRVSEEEVMARHARALGVPAEQVLSFHIPFSNAP